MEDRTSTVVETQLLQKELERYKAIASRLTIENHALKTTISALEDSLATSTEQVKAATEAMTVISDAIAEAMTQV